MDIVSFKHKGLRRFFEKNESRGLPQDRVRKFRQILMAINSAISLNDLNTLPGWRLHQLVGDRHNTWSITVSGNWRLTFVLKDEQLHNVDLEDYH